MDELYVALREFCRDQQAWLLDRIETLVRAESPTSDKAAVDRCGEQLGAMLTDLGGRVARVPGGDRGDHLLAEFGEASSQVLLLGHFDTVWPVGQLAAMPLMRRNGRLHGPGVYDMKAGIGLAMLAVRALTATGTTGCHRIVMLWTTDEEIGSGTSRETIEAQARRSDAVLVLEPSAPGGALKTSRKGCAGFEVIVTGVAAHAGIEPQKGASAIAELARQISRINAMQDLARGIHVNVVQMSGGERSNVIPAGARALVDVRVPTMGAWGEVSAAFAALTAEDPRTRVECRGWFDRPPLERTAGVARLYDQARDVARALGIDLAEASTGGGSDGNFTGALGVPTLDGLGAIGDGAHALHEHVEVASLTDRAALVAGLLAALGNRKIDHGSDALHHEGH